jgi:septal ring factor EnvC (AmiA/AmiB activator)
MEAAKTRNERASLEAALRERRRRQNADYEEARHTFAAYQAELAAWRQSAELRAADQWLNDTLADLETRGLLQWDRQT